MKKIKISTKEEALNPNTASTIEVQSIQCKCGHITKFHQYSEGLVCHHCGFNLEYKN